MLVANDAAWWHVRAQEALKFAGIKVCIQGVPYRSVMSLRETGREAGKSGFDPDLECVRTGGNSGQTAVHIVAQAEAARILLCGFDGGVGHWHGAHEAPLRNTSRVTWDRWRARAGELAKELSARGIEVWNCTPRSTLTCWPFADLETALASCAVPAPRQSALPA